MCLTVKKIIDNPYKTGFGYKVMEKFSTEPAVYTSPFIGCKLKINAWHTASYTGAYSTQGFHIFTSKRSAVKYKKWICNHKRHVIVKVKYKHIISKGKTSVKHDKQNKHFYLNTITAQHMRILNVCN